MSEYHHHHEVVPMGLLILFCVSTSLLAAALGVALQVVGMIEWGLN